MLVAYSDGTNTRVADLALLGNGTGAHERYGSACFGHCPGDGRAAAERRGRHSLRVRHTKNPRPGAIRDAASRRGATGPPLLFGALLLGLLQVVGLGRSPEQAYEA